MPLEVTVEEAQARLPELLAQLVYGEPLVITRDGKPVASLYPPPRTPGSAKDKILRVSPDFNKPIDDVWECLE